MSESIFKQIGSVLANAIKTAKSDMESYVNTALDEEIIVLEDTVDTILEARKKEELHRMLDTRIL